jgi:hypothetical protein
MLGGEYSLDETTYVATFTIRGFIDAGPKAEVSSGSISFDLDHQAEQLRFLQLDHPAAINAGCIHLHP